MNDSRAAPQRPARSRKPRLPKPRLPKPRLPKPRLPKTRLPRPRLLVEIVAPSRLWRAVPQARATIRKALATAHAALLPGDAVTAAMAAAVAQDTALTVALADDDAVRILNRDWRGRDAPTNVLSFPAPRPPAGLSGPVNLGDVVLACETVTREAASEGKDILHHVAHLAVHGFLHLAGFDHETQAEAEAMEALERAILAQLQIADPYAAVAEPHGIKPGDDSALLSGRST